MGEGGGGGGGGGMVRELRGDDERDWYLMCCSVSAITSNRFSEIVCGIIQHLLYMHVHMYCE